MFNLAPVPVPDLTGKTVLVTGAGRGIGAETVRVLVDSSAHVFAGIFDDHADTNEPLPEAATRLSLDVNSQAQVDAAIDRLREEAGRLDVLVNNAGTIAPIGHVSSLDSDDLIPALSVNVAGVHRVTVAALPLLRESRGVVINAGTGAATKPMEGWTAYCTSKAAMHMLTQMFDLELSDDGVKSFFIGIPPTDTAMQGAIRESGLNPISRISQSDLVPTAVSASVIAWLCGPEARKLDDVILDVRQERFTAMMDLQSD
ncbi:SDR family oxidoreductase [Hoeflea sp.]|uniref:SDR family oxidoreductase n=1 Tax=Hoeflea sp. TaxID=1940281 RepID=UPI003B01D893